MKRRKGIEEGERRENSLFSGDVMQIKLMLNALESIHNSRVWEY